MEHPHRPDRPAERRADAGEHRRRDPERAREPHRRRRRAQGPRAQRLHRAVLQEPAAARREPASRTTAATGAGGTQLIRDSLGGPVVGTIPGGYGDARQRGLRQRLPDLAGRREPRLRHPEPQREGGLRVGPHQQGAGARELPPARADGGGRGAHRRRAASSRASSGCSRPRPRASCRPSASTRRRRSSRPACPRTSSSRRPSATSPNAEVAELQAISDYRRSIINFQRVQEAGLSGTRLGGRPQRQRRQRAGRRGHPLGRGVVDDPEQRRRLLAGTVRAQGEAPGPPLFLRSHRRRAALDMRLTRALHP